MWTSDFARTYSTGKPNDIQRRAYRDLKEIQEETINAIKPGILAEHLFYVCKNAYERRKRPFLCPILVMDSALKFMNIPCFGRVTKL